MLDNVFRGRLPLRSVSTSDRDPSASTQSSSQISLLSYNIQSGIGTNRAHRYVTESWKQVLPHPEQLGLLRSIAQVIGEYDIVGLQEADVGSLRSGYINQAEYLANCAGFANWHAKTNRKIGNLAKSAVSTLSKLPLDNVRELQLPGRIPGRGALLADIDGEAGPLTLAVVHLALGRRDRLSQVAHLAEHLQDSEHVVVMGDLNCPAGSPEIELLQSRCGLNAARPDRPRTFPSWKPVRDLDHVLVSSGLSVERCEVLNHVYSDHRPVSVTLTWREASAAALEAAA